MKQLTLEETLDCWVGPDCHAEREFLLRVGKGPKEIIDELIASCGPFNAPDLAEMLTANREAAEKHVAARLGYA